MSPAFLGPIGLPELVMLLVMFLLIAGFITGIVLLVNYLSRPKIVIQPPVSTAPPPPPPLPQAAAGEKKE